MGPLAGIAGVWQAAGLAVDAVTALVGGTEGDRGFAEALDPTADLRDAVRDAIEKSGLTVNLDGARLVYPPADVVGDDGVGRLGDSPRAGRLRAMLSDRVRVSGLVDDPGGQIGGRTGGGGGRLEIALTESPNNLDGFAETGG